jgi:hypothetical protein
LCQSVCATRSIALAWSSNAHIGEGGIIFHIGKSLNVRDDEFLKIFDTACVHCAEMVPMLFTNRHGIVVVVVVI